MKKILPWCIIIALALGCLALLDRSCGDRAALQAALKVADEQAQATIAAKDAEIRALTEANADLLQKDAAAEAVKAQLRSALSTAQAEANKLREELKTAPPETLLAQTQTWLSTREIWLRLNAASETEAIFSLAAFRLNADALADRVFLRFTLVPNIQAQLAESERQNATKAVVIRNDLVIIADKDAIIAAKDSQLGARDDAIRALKKFSLAREARDFGAGFLAATLLHLIFGR